MKLTTQKRHSNKWALYCVTAIITLTGCAENNISDLSTFIADVKEKHKGQVEALPVISPYGTHEYTASQLRDPFRPSVSQVKEATLKRSSNGLKPNQVRNKEALERYTLQSLEMVGIMNNNGQNWAIIKTPDNSVFRVKKGNYIGENNGKISRISESGIDLKEIVADGHGGWIERKNKLSLAE